MIKILNPLIVLALFQAFLFAQFKYEKILFVPWGDAPGEIGFRAAPGGQFGPNSFTIDEQNQNVIILDTQHGKIGEYSRPTEEMVASHPIVSTTADDIIWETQQHYYILDQNIVTEYLSHKPERNYTTPTRRDLITALKTGDNTLPVFVINGSRSLTVNPNALGKVVQVNGIPVDHSPSILRLERQSSGRAKVLINEQESFSITGEDLGTVRYIGSTPDSLHYIYVENIVQQLPLKVTRRVDLVDAEGQIVASFDQPTTAHTYIFREFFIDRRGSLYRMVSTSAGIHIIGWIYSPDEGESERQHFPIPEEFRGSYHYNLRNVPEHIPPHYDSMLKVADYPKVTPGEALAHGETYIDHEYTVTSRNITNGLITDPGGVDLETPGWIVTGVISPVVYQWGGFNTLEQFDAGLAAGLSAGDKATTGVSNYAVGVDCSGFISRCWKLPLQYSTRMMDDEITIAYNSWDDLKPGDAIHKPGHVRMLVQRNSDGSLLAIESAGYNWRVWYRNYTLADLASYTPRYYINMLGTPANIPQPLITSVTSETRPSISWQTLSGTDALGIRIYASDTSSTWDDFLAGGLLNADGVQAILDYPERAPIFFKLHTVSRFDSVTESLPSDCYGYYNSLNSVRVLIVDGFDRYSGSGSYPLPYHAFARTLGLAIASNGFSFDTADNDAVISGEVDLNVYDAVFWSLGDESTIDETFNTSEQDLVTTYLKNGGHIFISGSEIGWDLDYKGSTADRDFFHNYLKVSYLADDSDSYSVNGAPGTIFDGLTIKFDNGSHGVYAEDYPDVLTTNGSDAVLKYATGQTAAVAYTGAVPGGTETARIIFMAFPFETIYNGSERISLIGKVFDYFGLEAFDDNGDPLIDPRLPRSFALHQNFPNPFNPDTRIRFDLPAEQKVGLIIYNLLGQEVTRLVDGVIPGGYYTKEWRGNSSNGQRVASGIYFARLVTSEYSKSIKMLLLK